MGKYKSGCSHSTLIADLMNLFRLFSLLLLLTGLLSCQDGQEKKPATIPPVSSDKTDTLASAATQENYPYYINTDMSPMDMSYFPTDYPKLKMANGKVIEQPVARVIYSRPHLSRRRFLSILKYDEPWRLGANESTEITFFKPVTIQNKRIAAGRYIIYCIPKPHTWTIALNTNIDTWGLKQDSTKDVQRFVIPVTHNNPPLEYFTMLFEKTDTGANLVMAWDDVVAKLPIQFK